jgi:hypothetical protein
MRALGLTLTRSTAFVILCAASVLSPPRLLRSRALAATPPVVTVTPAGTRIKVVSASLSETIDALARAAGFKVTYEGARPAAMLFNAEIDTPTVAQSLVRLLDGQNLNYGVVFDLSGRKVTSLLVLGVVSRSPAPPAGPGGVPRPQMFTTPRGSRNEPVPVDDDPIEDAEPEATPAPSAASPTPRAPGAPYPVSPFAPRPPFGSPFAPRPAPSPSP